MRELGELASLLGALTEDEFCSLCSIEMSTAEAWRKRHTGPRYVRLGNRYLYPIDEIRKFMEGRVRGNGPAPASLI